MCPDISMCRNEDCPSKEDCYRFKATPGFWQSYMLFEFDKDKGKCDSYWKLGVRDISNRLYEEEEDNV